jgi:hypothetical protein
LRLIIIALALHYGGCCPALPPASAITPDAVFIERTCQMPPLDLPTVDRTTAECPQNFVCYDTENAGRLAQRLANMRNWIASVKDRCSQKPVDKSEKKD